MKSESQKQQLHERLILDLTHLILVLEPDSGHNYKEVLEAKASVSESVGLVKTHCF